MQTTEGFPRRGVMDPGQFSIQLQEPVIQTLKGICSCRSAGRRKCPLYEGFCAAQSLKRGECGRECGQLG